ncbi:MAG: D-lyxose/D-mannose family sugar isomerase [Oscillospiraceae bacterium]|jgi:D-lyxose ketol-isomerase
MKRSKINKVIEDGIEFIQRMHFNLPDFAYWKPEDFKGKKAEYDEVFTNMLGWDVTDFGYGDFDNVGLLIFTLRNGSVVHPEEYPKPYCEKLLIVEDGQKLAPHYHYKKMEDIINRAGGNAIITLWEKDENDRFSDKPVTVTMDGRKITVPAGGAVKMKPGQSITLMPGQYHEIACEPGSGKLMLGEVSTVNDDNLDNHFLEPSDRIPEIEEDCAPTYLIFKDYPNYVD